MVLCSNFLLTDQALSKYQLNRPHNYCNCSVLSVTSNGRDNGKMSRLEIVDTVDTTPLQTNCFVQSPVNSQAGKTTSVVKTINSMADVFSSSGKNSGEL